jgi:hypothetical protein
MTTLKSIGNRSLAGQFSKRANQVVIDPKGRHSREGGSAFQRRVPVNPWTSAIEIRSRVFPP